MEGLLADCGPCPYLPGRRFTAFHPLPGQALPPYRALLDLRFRRSGAQLYAPVCADCAECRPMRVPVAAFAPARDQRRIRARNRDLAITWEERGCDGARRELFLRYQAAVHGESGAGSGSDPAAFLAEDGGMPGGELHATAPDGRLLAVAMVDLAGDALSSVYCYWEPAERRRGLGALMALCELALARELGLAWWYPGFLVEDCPKMAYKARYRPCQVLRDGVWRDRA